MPFSIRITDEELVVKLSGSVDVTVAPELRSTLDHAIESGFVDLAINLSAVNLLSADALGVLVSARTRAAHAGGSLRVIGAHDLVSTVLEVGGGGPLLRRSRRGRPGHRCRSPSGRSWHSRRTAQRPRCHVR